MIPELNWRRNRSSLSPVAITYATLDPANTHSDITLSGGNLVATKGGTQALRSSRSTTSVASGKWYWEATVTVGATSPFMMIGVGDSSVVLSGHLAVGTTGWAYYQETGAKYNNNTPTAYGSSWTSSDIIGVALDMDTGKVWFSKNGVWQAGGDPATGTGEAFNGISGNIFGYVSLYRGSVPAHVLTMNFGQTAFSYTVPSGFNSGLYS